MIRRDETKIFLRDDWMWNAIEMVIFQERAGKRYVAQPLVFVEHEQGRIVEPMIRFERDDNIPHQLIKEIRAMGLIENANMETLAALKYHLEDMRLLALKRRTKS